MLYTPSVYILQATLPAFLAETSQGSILKLPQQLQPSTTSAPPFGRFSQELSMVRRLEHAEERILVLHRSGQASANLRKYGPQKQVLEFVELKPKVAGNLHERPYADSCLQPCIATSGSSI